MMIAVSNKSHSNKFISNQNRVITLYEQQQQTNNNLEY